MDMSALPQDLTEMREEQRADWLQWLVELPMSCAKPGSLGLRQRQRLVVAQIGIVHNEGQGAKCPAIRERMERALDNLRIQETLLMEAILEKTA